MNPRIEFVVAMDENRVIGQDGILPWSLKEDLRRFRLLTIGKAIVMGRKTYESIGKPLPNRLNIILTRNLNYQAPGCDVVHTVDEAIAAASKYDSLYVIGGGEIYKLFADKVEIIHATIVETHIEEDQADTVFPDLESIVLGKKIISRYEEDEENGYPTRFEIWTTSPDNSFLLI